MALVTDDAGFHLFHERHGRLLVVESKRLDECMSRFYHMGYDGVVLSKYHGYTAATIDFLKEHLTVNRVRISAPVEDLSGLYAVRNLSELRIAETEAPLDLAQLTSVSELGLQWHRRVLNLASLRSLRRADMFSYKPNGDGFDELSGLQELRSVEFVGLSAPVLCDITTGLMPALERVAVSRSPRLTQIGRLAQSAPNLKELELHYSKNVCDLNSVRDCSALQRLALIEVGSIPSIAFVSDLPNLKHLRLVGTSIDDGDLSYCRHIESLVIDCKTHYFNVPEWVK